jgi:superoxide dismutase, Fe-Mn family
MEKKAYELPDLPYGYGDLKPHMSEEQLRLHHDKHHAAYVKGANDLIEKLQKARKDDAELDMKSTLKALSFNIDGHMLHSRFWKSMAPSGKGGGKPGGALGDLVDEEFGSFERFKKEFSQAAVGVEGSGWAALTLCRKTGRPLIMQVEKHNANLYIGCKAIMVLDVWEHAYYLDYKNDRAKFVEAFWNLVNWDEVAKKAEKAKGRGYGAAAPSGGEGDCVG